MSNRTAKMSKLDYLLQGCDAWNFDVNHPIETPNNRYDVGTGITQLNGSTCPLCSNLFIPNPDISGIGYFYGFIMQCVITSFLVCWLLFQFGASRKSNNHDAEKLKSTAGRALMNNFVPKLVNGAALVVAACLSDFEGESSNRHLRTALGLASLSGAQAVITMAVLFRNVRGNYKWWAYLLLYMASMIVFTWRIVRSLKETGSAEEYCTILSPRNETWGRYVWALGTVIITPIWLILVGVGAVAISGMSWFYRTKGHKRKTLRMVIMFGIWFALYGFMAGQIYWIFQLRFLYEQSYYAQLFQNDVYTAENKGEINLAGPLNVSVFFSKVGNSIASASVGQIVTYLVGIVPALEFIFGLWKNRKNLADMTPEELGDIATGGGDGNAPPEAHSSDFQNSYFGLNGKDQTQTAAYSVPSTPTPSTTRFSAPRPPLGYGVPGDDVHQVYGYGTDEIMRHRPV